MVKISGVSSGSIPVDQPSRGSAQAADKVQSGAAEPAAASAVQGEEVVSLSGRAEAASALFQGAAAADQPDGSAEVQRLSKTVTAGTYRPEAKKIASSLLSFERMIARKTGRD